MRPGDCRPWSKAATTSSLVCISPYALRAPANKTMLVMVFAAALSTTTFDQTAVKTA